MKVLIVDKDPELSDLLKNALWIAFYELAKQHAREQKAIRHGLDFRQVGTIPQAQSMLQEGEYVDLLFVTLDELQETWEFIEECDSRYRDKFGRMVLLAERHPQQINHRMIDDKLFLLKPFSPEDLMPHLGLTRYTPGSGKEAEEKIC